ncbi:Golgi transport complex subunit 3 [Arachnomyces sp. PD_36]|nr:Golgi transport complex subunit 3 [Arachnomyces sp. PD_36]
MGSQADSTHLRCKSNPIIPEKQGEIESVQGENNAWAQANEIRTEREFAGWYGGLEDGLLEAGYEEYQSCLDDLEMSRSHLDSLLHDTSSTLKLLTSLSDSFKAVDTQTSSFQKQCEGLLAAQTRDSKMVADIQDNLQYYDFLDPVSRRLNAPGAGNSVRGKEFTDMLRRLDECLDYMQAHPDQKDAETYRSRYRLLMTRALTLVRGHFVSALRDISSGVSKRIADRQLNDTTMSALLYAKFRVGASELKEVGLEIQKRVVPPMDLEQGTDSEYQNLLDELHSNFSATRAKLVIPLVRKKLNDIAQAPSTSTDLVSFSRASISYIRGICLDEFELWGEWFHGQGGLYDLLEAICEPLYDHLRPRIIHEVKLPKLCELCTLLQTRYLLDAEDEVEYTDPNQLDFAALIQPALEDTQTRVVFRTQAILRDEIERYKPRPEDLDYPSRNRQASQTESNNATTATSGRKRSFAEPFPKTPIVVDDDTGTSAEKNSRWDFDSQAVFEGWYPTLRKAIWLLSRIYRLVNSTVFDDLAHQIVHQTTLSLHQASVQISTKSSQIDGQLFLIKHLLILKQQIVAFDIEYVTPDVSFDFSGVTNTFWELRERGGLFNPRNLVQLVGRGLVPRVVENMLDAKAELDGRLRTVISEFTNGIATQMTSSLPKKVVEKPGTGSGGVVLPTCKAIEDGIPTLRQSLDDYLDDARTKETLVAAVQNRVLQIYEEFFNKYVLTQSNSGKAVSRNGKGAESSVWDLETFTEWCGQVFRVGVVGYQSSDEDEDDDEGPSRSLSRAGSL